MLGNPNYKGEAVMRITLKIDDLMQFIMKEMGARIKAKSICQALDDFVRRRKTEKLIALKGKVKFHKDWKRLRNGWTRTPRRTHWPIDFKTDRGD